MILSAYNGHTQVTLLDACTVQQSFRYLARPEFLDWYKRPYPTALLVSKRFEAIWSHTPDNHVCYPFANAAPCHNFTRLCKDGWRWDYPHSYTLSSFVGLDLGPWAHAQGVQAAHTYFRHHAWRLDVRWYLETP